MAWYGCTEIFTRTGRETPIPGWWTINFYSLQTSKAKILVNMQPQKCACGLGRAEPVLSLPNNKAVLLWVVSWWGFCGEEVFLVVKAENRGSGDLAPIPGSRNQESSNCSKHAHLQESLALCSRLLVQAQIVPLRRSAETQTSPPSDNTSWPCRVIAAFMWLMPERLSDLFGWKSLWKVLEDVHIRVQTREKETCNSHTLCFPLCLQISTQTCWFRYSSI